MGVIKQLPELVSNQISAGEVIERPASIVKELIENSIDAGSTQILIEIEDGGREKIRIKDNGKGIAEEDMELAFSRFATSKIENVNDLYSIRTLGFRGEALASIAAISKIEINSRSNESIKGTYMKLEGGELIKKNSVGLPVGTDIIINDIFYNTPARYKYLKTVSTEFGHISSVVSKEALAYPGIQFKLVHNNKEVLKTPGTDTLLDTIYAIYGKELVNNLIPIDFEESYVHINGFIARPEYYRSARIYELFFVNNRTVYNRSLLRGVEKGYYGILPPGKYPVVFLNLKLNQILVDVNVHPSKKEIKFSREEIIERIITKGINDTLGNINIAPLFKGKKSSGLFKEEKRRQLNFTDSDLNTENKLNNKNELAGGQNNYEKSFKPEAIHEEKQNLLLNEEAVNTRFNSEDKDINKDKQNNSRKNYQKNSDYINKPDNSNRENKILERNKLANTIVKDRSKKNKHNDEKTNQQKNKYPEKVIKILGQIENTYIIVEGIDGLYIVDQHNAHERVLYERNYEKYNKQDIITQSLLVPVNIEVSLEETEIINKYISELIKLGIKIESFGSNSFIVTEIPVYLKNLPSKLIIRELIDNLLESGETLKQAEIIDSIITYMSCRGAIKAGKHLEMPEMDKLITDLFITENPNRCPHGRPIIIHLSSEDIAKSMGR